MREIRFRAWDKFKKKMYLNVYFDNDTSVPRQVYSSDIDYLDFIMLSDCEVMQYTCLKDKNGKGINEACFYPNWIDNELEDYYFCDDMFRTRIIGNIYENPELLNNKGE